VWVNSLTPSFRCDAHIIIHHQLYKPDGTHLCGDKFRVNLINYISWIKWFRSFSGWKVTTTAVNLDLLCCHEKQKRMGWKPGTLYCYQFLFHFLYGIKWPAYLILGAIKCINFYFILILAHGNCPNRSG
jgi:hypothetical protein